MVARRLGYVRLKELLKNNNFGIEWDDFEKNFNIDDESCEGFKIIMKLLGIFENMIDLKITPNISLLNVFKKDIIERYGENLDYFEWTLYYTNHGYNPKKFKNSTPGREDELKFSYEIFIDLNNNKDDNFTNFMKKIIEIRNIELLKYLTKRPYEQASTIRKTINLLPSQYLDFDEIYYTNEDSTKQIEEMINVYKDTKSSLDGISKFKIGNEQIKEYLINIVNIYNNIYLLKERFVQISTFDNKQLNNIYKDMISTIIESSNEIYNIEKEIIKYKKEPILLTIKDVKKIIKPPIFNLIEPTKPKLLKAGLFNKKSIQLKNEQNNEEYLKKIDEYNREKKKYDASMEEYASKCEEYLKEKNDDIIEQHKKELLKIENLNEKFGNINVEEKFMDNVLKTDKNEYKNYFSVIVEQKKILSELEKNVILLEKLYSANIIYEKYRNFVSTSTFVDYFSSGRVRQFDGPDGAYNLFEQESRQNIIINKLDNIENKLEDIKEYQYYLYKELKDINSKIDEVKDQLYVLNLNQYKTLKHLEKIEFNTLMTTYYSKINATYTQTIAFLELIK